VRRSGARQRSTATLPSGQTGVPIDALDSLVMVAPALAPQLPRQQGHAPPRMIAGALLPALSCTSVTARRRCPAVSSLSLDYQR
jgi:hypothetical protein